VVTPLEPSRRRGLDPPDDGGLREEWFAQRVQRGVDLVADRID
jgi:hypothetical protein